MDELLARWKKGDFDAFSTLLDPHLTALRAYAAWCSPPSGPWSKDDLLQEALVEAFRSAKSFDPQKSSLQPWLQAIVRQRILRAWQDFSRNSRRQHLASRHYQEACAQAFERQADSAALLGALTNCVDRLPQDQKELLQALYTQGETSEEIAARKGQPLGTVYVALHRIHQTVRECVEGILEGKGSK